MNLTLYITLNGFASYTAQADVPTCYRLVELVDENTVKITDTIGEKPYGITPDQAVAGDALAVGIFGAIMGGHLVVAGDDIVAGDELVSDDQGRAIPLPTDPGTYFVFGISFQDAATDDEFGFAPCYPQERVVV